MRLLEKISHTNANLLQPPPTTNLLQPPPCSDGWVASANAYLEKEEQHRESMIQRVQGARKGTGALVQVCHNDLPALSCGSGVPQWPAHTLHWHAHPACACVCLWQLLCHTLTHCTTSVTLLLRVCVGRARPAPPARPARSDDALRGAVIPRSRLCAVHRAQAGCVRPACVCPRKRRHACPMKIGGIGV